MQDKAHTDAHHHHVDQRGQRGVTGRVSGDDVRIDGERDAADGHDARSQSVKTVHEIDRVDRSDNKECRNCHGQARGCGDQRASQRQRNNLQTTPGHENGNQQLTGELQHPVKIPQIIGHAQQTDHNAAGKNHPHLVITLEQTRKERRSAGKDGGHGKSDQHAKAAHTRGGNGMHIAGAHFANRADLDGHVANQRSHQPGDATRDGRDQ